MSVELSFRADGVPVGQAATRYAVGGPGQRGHSYYYNDKALRAWRGAVADAAAEDITRAGPGFPFLGPAQVEMVFVVPRKVADPKRQPIKRNDLDLSHLVRAVEDALTAARVWKDDSQVVDLHAWKMYPGVIRRWLPILTQEPGVVINVLELEVSDGR